MIVSVEHVYLTLNWLDLHVFEIHKHVQKLLHHIVLIDELTDDFQWQNDILDKHI